MVTDFHTVLLLCTTEVWLLHGVIKTEFRYRKSETPRWTIVLRLVLRCKNHVRRNCLSSYGSKAKLLPKAFQHIVDLKQVHPHLSEAVIVKMEIPSRCLQRWRTPRITSALDAKRVSKKKARRSPRLLCNNFQIPSRPSPSLTIEDLHKDIDDVSDD
jgi:hypothetical protein